MTLGGLGSREQSRAGLPVLAIFSALILLLGVVLFGRELVTYSSRSVDSLQADVVIAGVQVGGLSASEAQNRWEAVYLDQPITLIYKGSPIVVSPRSLGFRTNNEAMLARAQSDNDGTFWEGFWAYLLGHQSEAVQVELDAAVQEGQLRAFLDDIAVRYDSGPGEIGFDLATLTFQSGASGSRLDIEGSVEVIRAALFNPDPAAREVELPTLGVTAESASMDDLRQAILQYMDSIGFLHDGVTTIGSVFIMDLKTGEEMSILGDVAHSAVSTIKIPVMINYYRYQVTSPDPDSAYLLASAIICSHNPGANFLMQSTSSDGNNMIQGLQNASETMLEVGAINSWITSPLYVGPDGNYPVIAPPQRPNLANQNYDAQPDPLNRTTAEDMGTLMQMIYECANAGGGIRGVYPEDITQDECAQMLEVLSGVRFSRFTELSVPEGTLISHKVGYGAETVGDVAIVYSPATDYVFVMYIWEEDLDNDFLTELDKWDLIDKVARIAYNYFNPAQPMLESRPPDNPQGGAACVLPRTTEEINLNNIAENRFDDSGNPVSTACYDWPQCRPFDNWGRGE